MTRRLPLFGLAVTIAIAGSVAPSAAQELTRAAFENLKQGGFVVVLRHGKTNAVAGLPEDKSPLDLANCADQAMLSEAGRDQARAIGTAFASARIPVGKVLASGYCRAIEMARLAFGRVEASDSLLLPTFVAVAGARMYAFKVVETAGRFKETDGGVWTAQEIAESWDAIVKG